MPSKGERKNPLYVHRRVEVAGGGIFYIFPIHNLFTSVVDLALDIKLVHQYLNGRTHTEYSNNSGYWNENCTEGKNAIFLSSKVTNPMFLQKSAFLVKI